jgi:hypothetical protein
MMGASMVGVFGVFGKRLGRHTLVPKRRMPVLHGGSANACVPTPTPKVLRMIAVERRRLMYIIPRPQSTGHAVRGSRCGAMIACGSPIAAASRDAGETVPARRL